MRRTLFSSLVLLIAACTHTPPDPLSEVFEDPLRADGRTYEVAVYPFDYARDPRRYVMCQRPCSQAYAADHPVVIVPLRPGAYDGMVGAELVQVKVTFRANCFRPNSACPHRPFVFQEVQ